MVNELRTRVAAGEQQSKLAAEYRSSRGLCCQIIKGEICNPTKYRIGTTGDEMRRRLYAAFDLGLRDWSLLDLAHLAALPAIRWRLQNVQQLARIDSARWRALCGALDQPLAAPALNLSGNSRRENQDDSVPRELLLEQVQKA
ncbi:MAG: hypothetical protein ABI665_28895 [Vicinamibacterales bacterium]